jgi:hypothetical protein
VTIGATSTVEAVETVNGSVRIEERAVVESAETVNGDVTIGDGAEVREDVETVNGDITLRSGARIGGSVANVNGDMLIEGASVGGGLETVNADIRLTSGARVSGGIRVEKNNGNGRSWLGKEQSNPKITVEQGAVLEGPLVFEREVDLYVAPGVTLPAVQGVQPKRYTLQ